MNSRPKLLISVAIFNSEGDKILMGKRYDEGTLGTLHGKLEYGETFEECASRLLSTMTNILVEDGERVKFICTYNAVDKSNSQHFVSADYYLQITKEEEKFHLMVDPYYFQSWNWYSFEEILKLADNLFFGLQIFLNKFNIKSLDDFKTLVSN